MTLDEEPASAAGAFNFAMPHDQDGVTITPIWPPDAVVQRLGPATDDDENRVRYRVEDPVTRRSKIYRVGEDITDEFSDELRKRVGEVVEKLPDIYREVFADRERAHSQRALHEGMVRALVESAKAAGRLNCKFDEPGAEDFVFLSYFTMCAQALRTGEAYHHRAQMGLEMARVLTSEASVMLSAWFGVNLPIYAEPWRVDGKMIDTEWDGKVGLEIRVKIGPLPMAVDGTTMRDDMLVSNIPTMFPEVWCMLHPADAENPVFRSHVQRIIQGANLAVPRGPRLIRPN